MRSRLRATLTDRATIRRRDDSDTDDGSTDGGGLYDDVDTSSGDAVDYDGDDSFDDVEVGVPCQFDAESTAYVRDDSGERVKNPATVTFDASVDVEENDRVHIQGVDETFEVEGVDPTTDHFRGVAVSYECSLRRTS